MSCLRRLRDRRFPLLARRWSAVVLYLAVLRSVTTNGRRDGRGNAGSHFGPDSQGFLVPTTCRNRPSGGYFGVPAWFFGLQGLWYSACKCACSRGLGRDLSRKKPKSESVIAWITITYRSVAIASFSLVLFAGVIVYLVFPDSRTYTGRVWQSTLSRLDSSVGSTEKFVPGKQQAHFTAIDGRVRVKKANSNTWVAADYSLPLEKGDVVQTTSEGMAKVAFADGTNYTIKQDSLIVVEENSATRSSRRRWRCK